MHLSYHTEMAENPGGPTLYQFLRQRFFWLITSVDCYAISRNCISCDKNKVALRWNSKGMQLFPASVPLEFGAIDILGQLLNTKQENRFLLVITNRFSPIVKTTFLTKYSGWCNSKCFCACE